jgi:hypothetical protein
VVPLKPFSANKAAAIMLACRALPDDLWFFGAGLDFINACRMLVSKCLLT